MKKNLLLLFLCFIVLSGKAQEFSSSLDEVGPVDTQNIIKINMMAFAARNVSLQYERAIGNKTTLAANVNFMTRGKLPFLSQFESIIDDDFTYQYAKTFKVSGFLFTPEVRFYLGQSAFRGFYIAPFVRYSTYKGDINLEIEVEQGRTDSFPISGRLNAFSGGFSLGAQWRLSEHFYLDWMIMGPHFGFSNGKFSGSKDLSEYEIEEYKGELSNFDIPMLKVEYVVNDKGATARFKGPWAGIRTGFSLGYRF